VKRRREFLLEAGAAALAAGLESCGSPVSNTPLPPAGQPYDLIVVGAGISGIAAARTAQGYGAKTLVLEAQSYIGGRTFTDTTTFAEIGFDLGAQFFQQCISGNELWQIAQTTGATLLPAAGPGGLGQQFMEGSAEASAFDQASFLATSAAIKAAIFTAGAAIQAGAPDASVQSVIGGLSSLPWYNAAVSQSVIEIIGDTDRSILDLYNFQLVEPIPFATPGDDYVIKSGMGAFVTALAKGLPIQLTTPVKSVATGGATVTVTTASGQVYNAKTAIVTASTAVLASGGIAFTPALPSAYAQAFAGLPLSNIYKALIGLKPSFQINVPGVGTGFSVVLTLTDSDSAAMFPNFWGTNTVEFIANGNLALSLENAGPSGARPMLLAALDAAFPGAAAQWDGRMTASAWTNNPYTKGAYSGALPGDVGARSVLQQPIAGQLWFAGEAVNATGSRGVLQGAYRSGIAAATGALRTIGLASSARGAGIQK
jgi:monoamine oxidase